MSKFRVSKSKFRVPKSKFRVSMSKFRVNFFLHMALIRFRTTIDSFCLPLKIIRRDCVTENEPYLPFKHFLRKRIRAMCKKKLTRNFDIVTRNFDLANSKFRHSNSKFRLRNLKFRLTNSKFRHS